MLPHSVITGGASGLGLGCSARFLALGYRVTIADVDEAAGRAAVDALEPRWPGRCRFERVDLAAPGSIANVASRLFATNIDVLVNNAGIYPPSQRTLTAEGQELTFAIAHLGHFRLTHAFWPALTRQPAARVVSISSLVQRQARIDLQDLTLARGYQPIRAYQQAKLACLLFAIELQRRLDIARSSVRSYAAHPGVCRTGLGRNRAIGGGDAWHQRLASRALAFGLSHIGQSPERGAESVIVASTDPSLPPGSFVGPSGLLEAFGKPRIIRPGPAAADAGMAAALWTRTEELTGIQWTF